MAPLPSRGNEDTEARQPESDYGWPSPVVVVRKHAEDCSGVTGKLTSRSPDPMGASRDVRISAPPDNRKGTAPSTHSPCACLRRRRRDPDLRRCSRSRSAVDRSLAGPYWDPVRDEHPRGPESGLGRRWACNWQRREALEVGHSVSSSPVSDDTAKNKISPMIDEMGARLVARWPGSDRDRSQKRLQLPQCHETSSGSALPPRSP